VDATAGEILTFEGKIFPAYFHSTCGGATTRAEQVWDVEPHPSLKGVACSFCKGSKHYRWRADVAGFDLPVRVTIAKDRFEWIHPVTGAWKTAPADVDEDEFRVDPNFYVAVEQTER